jgi:hypothetical protein
MSRRISVRGDGRTEYWGLLLMRNRVAAGLLSCFVLVGCGSRSKLSPAVLFCDVDSDCDRSNLCAANVCEAGTCVPAEPVVCEPSSACVTSECNPGTGLCDETPVTTDEDQDGYFAPRPGYLPGAPGACGDDCDDSSALARPDGIEVCDGTDNDCDGIVDNGSELLPGPNDDLTPIRVPSAMSDRSGSGSIAYGAGYFAMTYSAHVPSLDKLRSYFRGLSFDGLEVVPETRINQVNSPSWSASLAWSGSAFGAAWSDGRRAQNYEIYFSLFDPTGEKRIMDLQLTDASDMSLDPEVLYDQGRFLVFWPDRRNGNSQLFMQMLSPSGKAIGGNVTITPQVDSVNAESPSAAAALETYGLVYLVASATSGALEFRTFEKKYLTEVAPVVTLAQGTDEQPRLPRVVALRDKYLVTWHVDKRQDGPRSAIFAAILDERGNVLHGPTAITPFGARARDAGTVSFGDRALLGWADDVEGSYEIYAQVIDENLSVIEEPIQLTDTPRDSVGPDFARSEDGKLGMLFNDSLEGPSVAYFLSFGCSELVLK